VFQFATVVKIDRESYRKYDNENFCDKLTKFMQKTMFGFGAKQYLMPFEVLPKQAKQENIFLIHCLLQ